MEFIDITIGLFTKLKVLIVCLIFIFDSLFIAALFYNQIYSLLTELYVNHISVDGSSFIPSFLHSRLLIFLLVGR